MTKRFERELDLYRPKNKVHFTLGVLVCMVFSVCMLIVSSFTVIHLTHYGLPLNAILHPIWFSNTQHTINDFIINFDYVPQIPAIAIIVVILGKKYGFFTALMYLFLGIFILPVFSLGGGVSYIFQYGFGYFIGFLVMIYILGRFIEEDLKFKNVFLGTLYSILSLHVIGSLYLVLICAIKHEPFSHVQDLLYMMTFVKIMYDIVITIISVYVANIVKKILWLAIA